MRQRGWLRLVLLCSAALVLGYLLQSPPGVKVYQLPGDWGYIGVPRSLEGWRLTPGAGNVLVQGQTRFGLMQLELEKTDVPIAGELVTYISERHERLFLAHDGYQALLSGETEPFGIHQVPTARAVYDGELFGIGVRMVQHDAYWLLKDTYVRVGLRFPAALDRYFWADQQTIANYLNLSLPPEEARP